MESLVSPKYSVCFELVTIRRMNIWIKASMLVLLAGSIAAQELQSGLDDRPKPTIDSIGNGIFKVGGVRLDKNTSTLSFPGSVNMTNLVVEYAIVGEKGKRHESVLAAKVPPHHIHLAALLLGATNRTETVASGSPLAGHPMDIWISWSSGEVEMRVPLENLIRKGSEGPRMTRGVWLYNGSRVIGGTFIAERDESIVSIMEDPDALVNNPRPGRENDDLWFVNGEVVPPMDTPVEITFDFGVGR